MVKQTNVVICDGCREKIATKSCDICEDDLCNVCSKEVRCSLGENWQNRIIDLNLCKKCKTKTLKLVEEDFKKYAEGITKGHQRGEKDSIIAITNKFIIDLVKKKGILKQLEEKE